MKDSTERYSFRIHRRQAWSLEHIHAQNAESLTKAEQWKEWLRLHRDALADLPAVDQARREQLLDRDRRRWATRSIGGCFRSSRATSRLHSRSLTRSAAATAHSVHSIANLALARERRQQRAEQLGVRGQADDASSSSTGKGAYIPVCTRNVFLKYYTDADAQQIHFWSTQDRESYLTAILSSDGGVGRLPQARGAAAS